MTASDSRHPIPESRLPKTITLTTDFGTSDTFVSQMKGVILSIAPRARIVDVTHDVPAQDVMAGAIVLESVLDVFQRGTIHVAVVDPGVGSKRRAVAIETEDYLWVGPDNGVFTTVLARQAMRQAVALTNPAYHRSNAVVIAARTTRSALPVRFTGRSHSHWTKSEIRRSACF